MNGRTRDQKFDTAFWALLKTYQGATFKWGECDCVTLASAVVRLSRPDFPELPTWNSLREALELLNGKSLPDRVTELLGAPIPWGHCVRGDIALASGPSIDGCMPSGLVIFDGAGFLTIHERGGLGRAPFDDVQYGWEV